MAEGNERKEYPIGRGSHHADSQEQNRSRMTSTDLDQDQGAGEFWYRRGSSVSVYLSQDRDRRTSIAEGDGRKESFMSDATLLLPPTDVPITTPEPYTSVGQEPSISWEQESSSPPEEERGRKTSLPMPPGAGDGSKRSSEVDGSKRSEVRLKAAYRKTSLPMPPGAGDGSKSSSEVDGSRRSESPLSDAAALLSSDMPAAGRDQQGQGDNSNNKSSNRERKVSIQEPDSGRMFSPRDSVDSRRASESVDPDGIGRDRKDSTVVDYDYQRRNSSVCIDQGSTTWAQSSTVSLSVDPVGVRDRSLSMPVTATLQRDNWDESGSLSIANDQQPDGRDRSLSMPTAELTTTNQTGNNWDGSSSVSLEPEHCSGGSRDRSLSMPATPRNQGSSWDRLINESKEQDPSYSSSDVDISDQSIGMPKWSHSGTDKSLSVKAEVHQQKRLDSDISFVSGDTDSILDQPMTFQFRPDRPARVSTGSLPTAVKGQVFPPRSRAVVLEPITQTSAAQQSAETKKIFVKTKKPLPTLVDEMIEPRDSGKTHSEGDNKPHIILVAPDRDKSAHGKFVHKRKIRQEPDTTEDIPADQEDQHLTVQAPRKRANSFPDDALEPGSSPMPVSPDLSTALGSGLDVSAGTASGLTPVGGAVSVRDEDAEHAHHLKNLANLTLKAKRWMRKSGQGKLRATPSEVEASNQQSRRPLVDIPRAMKLDIWKEAHPILQKMYETYKSSLGEDDPLTQLAKARMEANEAKYNGQVPKTYHAI